jgi:hypothetical protein
MHARWSSNSRSVDSYARASYLGTRRLACQDGSHWLASSSLGLQRCKAKIRPALILSVNDYDGDLSRPSGPVQTIRLTRRLASRLA